MATKQFEELEVWRAAKTVVVDVYRMSSKGPLAADAGFRSQIQRAAISTLANIAEGLERGGDRELIHFLFIAKGSAAEVRSLLHVGTDLGYMTEAEKAAMLTKVASISRQLGGFISYLKNGRPAAASGESKARPLGSQIPDPRS